MVRFKNFLVHLILFGVITFILPAVAENTGVEDDLIHLHLVTEKQALRQALLNVDAELAFRFSKSMPSDMSDIQHTIAKLNITLADEIDSHCKGRENLLSAAAPEKIDVNDQNAIMSQRWALLRVWFTRLYLSADEFSRDRMLEYFLSDAMLSFSAENYHLATRQFRFILLAFEEEFTCLDGAYFYAAESNLALGYFNEAGFLFEKLITTYPKSAFYATSVKRILQMSALLNRPESFEKYLSENDKAALFTAENMVLLHGISCLNAGDQTRALKYFRQVNSDSPDYAAAQQQIIWLEYRRALDLNSLPYKNEMPDFLAAIATCQAGEFVAAENKFHQISLTSPHEVNALAAEILAEYCHLRQTRTNNPPILEKESKDTVSPLFYLADQNKYLAGQRESKSEKPDESQIIIADILQVRGLNPAYQYLFQQLCRRQLNVQLSEQNTFSDIELRWQQKLKSAKWLNRGNGHFRLPETAALIQLDLAQLRLLRDERAWYQLSGAFLEKYTLSPSSYRFEQLRFNFDQITNLSINRQQLLENKSLISEHISKKQQDLEAELRQYDKRMHSVQGKIQNEQDVMEKQERQVYFDTIYFNEALDTSPASSRLQGGVEKAASAQSPFSGPVFSDSIEVAR